MKDKIINAIKRRMSLSNNLLKKVDRIFKNSGKLSSEDNDDFYKKRIGKLKSYLQLSTLLVDNIGSLFDEILGGS